MCFDPDAFQKIVDKGPRVDLQSVAGVDDYGIRDYGQPSVRDLVAELGCGEPADVSLDANCHQ